MDMSYCTGLKAKNTDSDISKEKSYEKHIESKVKENTELKMKLERTTNDSNNNNKVQQQMQYDMLKQFQNKNSHFNQKQQVNNLSSTAVAPGLQNAYSRNNLNIPYTVNYQTQISASNVVNSSYPNNPSFQQNINNNNQNIAMNPYLYEQVIQQQNSNNINNQGFPSHHHQQQELEISCEESSPRGENITSKEAIMFLDALENYHISCLTSEQKEILDKSNFRTKPKHRNAILFADDKEFLFGNIENVRFEPEEYKIVVEEGFKDTNHYLLHKAIHKTLNIYKKSRMYATERSCIYSALLYRVAYHLDRSGVKDVHIKEHVPGVLHKEATIFIGDYHLSRSNFTKVVRQMISNKEI